MECSRFFRFFQGLWTFNREVRSLLCPSRKLLASIDSGKASFVEWNNEPPQGQPAMNPQTSTAQEASLLRFLLYREQGLLANHELDKSVPAASVSRQYIYTFPSLEDKTTETQIQVYHCSIKDRTLSALDPWCEKPEEDLSLCFTKGEHFHDLVFAAVRATSEKISDVRTKCVHYCDPDVYEGEFHLVTCQKFSITWTVQGPNKAFSIVTVYEKNVPEER